ncbi:hypothetical protein [Halolamina sp. CBA1230]|nr:hypothetical protein [Halolamina sp. CBA1230]
MSAPGVDDGVAALDTNYVPSTASAAGALHGMHLMREDRTERG